MNDPMKTRILTSIVGIAVLILVMLAFDTVLFNLVIALISLIAIHEVYKALGFDKKAWPLYAAMVPYTLLIMLCSMEAARAMVLPASFVILVFYCIYLVARNGVVSYVKVGGFTMYAGIILYCFYSLIRLKILLPRSEYGYDAIFFILLILCFAWGGDTCAYFAGRAFGKHKLCPVVSPKKTVEGAIGGVLGTMVFGVVATVIYSIAADRTEAFTRSNIGVSMYLIIALLGIVAAVLGIYGDLFASVVKRQCGIKDYGTIFPGHGGILDRFDSVMFIAPFVSMVITAVFYH
jgi:phosphatidate cytidylyltransferase